MKKLILIFYLIATAITLGKTQSIQNQVIAGAGLSTVNINSLDWTLGEPMVEYFKQGVQIHQGFHQVNTTRLTTSIKEILAPLVINMYPNPTSDYLNIEAVDDMSGVFMKISNMNGALVYKSIMKGNTQAIDIRQYSEGTYTVQLFKNKQVASYKFIKITR